MFERFKNLKNESARALPGTLPVETLSDKELANRARSKLADAARDLDALMHRGFRVEIDFALGYSSEGRAHSAFRPSFTKTEMQEL